MQNIALNTGAQMPILGLGTWKSPAGEVGRAVEYALTEAGYTHLDCAAIYHNQPEIGQALTKIFASGHIRREEIFITSKLWNNAHAEEDVEPACRQTLQDLQLNYLDLYLMHFGMTEVGEDQVTDGNGKLINPKIPIRETWEAMEKLVGKGLVKAVGISNFTGPMIVDLLSYAKIVPAVNQIELHPYNRQERMIGFCKKQGIEVTAYSPLGTPGNVKIHEYNGPILLDEPIIKKIAAMHGKSPAQVLIRWAIERKTVVIPKSVTPANIKANAEVFDFSLTKKEMDEIATLDRRHRFVNPWAWWGVPYFD